MNIELEKLDTHEQVNFKALLNCGATGMFMSPVTAHKYRFKLRKLEQPIQVKNVDGSWNKGGEVLQS